MQQRGPKPEIRLSYELIPWIITCKIFVSQRFVDALLAVLRQLRIEVLPPSVRASDVDEGPVENIPKAYLNEANPCDCLLYTSDAADDVYQV